MEKEYDTLYLPTVLKVKKQCIISVRLAWPGLAPAYPERSDPMKRCCLILIALLLVLAYAWSAQGEEFFVYPTDELGYPIPLTSVVAWGDQAAAYSPGAKALYLSGTPQQVYPVQLDAGDTQAQLDALEKALLSYGREQIVYSGGKLLSDGQALYLLDNYVLYRLDMQENPGQAQALCFCDPLPDNGTRGDPFIFQAALSGGQLYALVSMSALDNSGVVQRNLYAYALETGQRRELPLDGLSTGEIWGDVLLSLGEGEVLYGTRNPDNVWSYWVYTAASDAFRPLYEAYSWLLLPEDAEIVGYDPAQGRFLYVSSRTLYAAESGSAARPVYRISSYTYEAALLSSGQVLLLQDHEAAVIDPAQPMEITTLRLYLDGGNVDAFAFEQENPDIQLAYEFVSEQPSARPAADMLSAAVSSRTSQIDIFGVPMGTFTRTVMEKGYYVPVTGEETEAFVASAYAYITEEVVDSQGQLAMVPMAVRRNNTLNYSSTAAEALGIDPTTLPRTYGELLDFIRQWDSQYGDAAEALEISLFDTRVGLALGKIKTMLLRDVLALAQSKPETAEAQLDTLAALFDEATALGREVSDRVTPPSIGVFEGEYNYDDIPEELYDGAYLFSMNLSALPSSRIEEGPYRYWTHLHPLELSLWEGEAPMAIYAGYALVINPYSEHQEEAMRYLRYFLENLPEAQAANVLSGTKLVTSSEYMYFYTSNQMYLEQMEYKAQNLSGAELEQAQYWIDFYSKAIAAYEPFIYAVTEAQIAEHAASVAATQAVWLETDVYVDGSAAAWEQFLAGKINSRQLLERIMEISRMAHQEG